MSKLIDKLTQVSQAESQAMGFRAAQTTSPKPRILLIASLAQNDAEQLAEHVGGADAGLVHISDWSSGAKILQTMHQTTSDIPWA